MIWYQKEGQRVAYIFKNYVEQEIRPVNKLSDKRIEGLPTRGKVRWG